MTARCKIISDCQSCDFAQYQSGGRYRCAAAKIDFPGIGRPTEPPDWCPLPVYRAAQPADPGRAALAAPPAAPPVPAGWSISPLGDGTVIVSHNAKGGYAAHPAHDQIASAVLAAFATDVLAAAQPVPATGAQPAPAAVPATVRNEGLDDHHGY